MFLTLTVVFFFWRIVLILKVFFDQKIFYYNLSKNKLNIIFYFKNLNIIQKSSEYWILYFF